MVDLMLPEDLGNKLTYSKLIPGGEGPVTTES